jgi:hypothetical protein
MEYKESLTPARHDVGSLVCSPYHLRESLVLIVSRLLHRLDLSKYLRDLIFCFKAAFVGLIDFVKQLLAGEKKQQHLNKKISDSGSKEKNVWARVTTTFCTLKLVI